MFSPTIEGVKRRLALIGALAALVMGVGTATAFASVTLNPAAPGPYKIGGQKVKVRGTAPAEAVKVGIAVCNTEFALGTRCDGAKAVPGLKPVADYEATPAKLEIEVRRGPWQNWDFTSGPPHEVAGSTTCKNTAGVGSQCAVVVSYYKEEGGVPVQLTGTEDVANIEFCTPVEEEEEECP